MGRRYYFSDKLQARRSRKIKFFSIFFVMISISAGFGLSNRSCAGDGASVASSSLEAGSCLSLLQSVRPPETDPALKEIQPPAEAQGGS